MTQLALVGVVAKAMMTPAKVNKAVDDGTYKNLRHAGASIRKSAIESMIFAEGPSKPGKPPHAHKGRLRRSIVYTVDEASGELYVGASYSKVKIGGRPPWLAQMLERGGTYQVKQKRKRRGRPRKDEPPVQVRSITFPPRPFMVPALERNLDRFHASWKHSIGS